MHTAAFWVSQNINLCVCAVLPKLNVPSLLVTVLMMWISLNSATPRRARSSAAGIVTHSVPVMLICGSLGTSTITTAFMSGMEMHKSSPKHLHHTGTKETLTEDLHLKALLNCLLLKWSILRRYWEGIFDNEALTEWSWIHVMCAGLE